MYCAVGTPISHTHWQVVNYWLLNCVLPLETRQYPSRLVATAWHLAHNPTCNVVGCSGTNDSHRLLPHQVQQASLDEAPELEGTNGKMLDMLLSHGRYKTLELVDDGSALATGQVRPGNSVRAVDHAVVCSIEEDISRCVVVDAISCAHVVVSHKMTWVLLSRAALT